MQTRVQQKEANMKQIKRIAAWLITLVLVLSLFTGCGAGAEAPAGSFVSSVVTESRESAASESSEEKTSKEEASKEEAQQPEQETQEAQQPEQKEQKAQEETAGLSVEEDGSYTSKEQVALYLHTYGHLPGNYITKKDAEKLGWDSKAGNLDEVAPGKSIGGSRFGNYEGQLPDKDGRKYYECDLDYEGGYRGAKRLIYSNDGLIFYTEDHYKSFEQLY
jgi:hypothetical protein